MPPFVAYHRVPAQVHQAKVDELAPQGYRPLSLSVSGDPGDPRYAAVWVQRPGPAWWAVHGLGADAYQARFDELVAGGFAPVVVSATGSAGDATFAAVFEQGVPVPWFARHHLTWGPVTDPDTVTHENQRAYDQGYLPRSLAVYGTPGDRRFAGVWFGNVDPVPWSWWWTDPSAYQRFFDGEVRAGMRPAQVCPASDGFVLSVFRDEPIGAWWARHGLTGDEYQVEFEARRANGAMPISVQVAGAGDDARFAAVFAQDDTPLPRRWSATGAGDAAGIADLDAAVRAFMTAHAIRAGTVAVARGGSVVVARGYTWAEDGYAVTQPTTTMRTASVAKLFTAAAVDALVAAGTGQLTWATAAFPYLGITGALLGDQSPDAATAGITVRQLVERRSGLQRDFGTDLRGVAARLGSATTPTRPELVHFIYGEPLAVAPGSMDLYSNSAFTVLTSVVEAASGRAFIDVVRDVAGGLGITDIWVAGTAGGGLLPGEVPSYDHPGVALTQLDPTSDAMAPNAYGGDFVLEVGEGAGGLVTSSPSVARFIGGHAVWDVGPRQLATRYGTFDGTTTGAVSRADGLDLAFMFNRRVTDPEHDQITAALNGVLDSHGGSWHAGASPFVHPRLEHDLRLDPELRVDRDARLERRVRLEPDAPFSPPSPP